MKANDVITIGRKRARAASLAASRIGLPAAGLIPRTPADLGKFHKFRSANGGDDRYTLDRADACSMSAFGQSGH
jgi:hypothetical protein